MSLLLKQTLSIELQKQGSVWYTCKNKNRLTRCNGSIDNYLVVEMLFEIICSVFVPILLYVVISYIEHLLECRKLPRGPFPLPIVGNLHLFGTRPYQTFANYSKLYGNVFSISFGMKRVVIISDITATREALIEKAIIFAGRPKSYNTEMFSRGYKDIAFKDYGPLWKLLRKIGHSSLKIYGEGAGRFETLMIKESDALHERLKKKSKNPMELQTEFGKNYYFHYLSFISFIHHRFIETYTLVH